MKKFFTIAASLIILVAATASPLTAAAAPAPAPDAVENLWAMVPQVLIVKQTATLSDGRRVTIYYKRSGNNCEVYSADDLKGYSVNDLAKVTESDFSIATSTEGKCVYHATLAQVRKVVKRMVNRYL